MSHRSESEAAPAALRARVRSLASSAAAPLAELTRALAETLWAASVEGVPAEEVPVIDPDLCDRIASGSAGLRRLDRYVEALARQPGSAEEWVATRSPAWAAARTWEPSPEALLPIANGDRSWPKPRGGLFTCTAGPDAPGLWRTFLDTAQDDQQWPKPWRAWHLAPASDADVRVVASAAQWAELVAEHHVRAGRFLLPDWKSLSRRMDALRFTPTAVCAIDGQALGTAAGTIVPLHWSVPGTLWMRWRFVSVSPAWQQPAV